MRSALVAAWLAQVVVVTQRPLGIVGSVKSPDGRTVIEIRHWPVRASDFGPFVYHVTRDGEDVVADSPLGIRRADQSFDADTLTFVGATEFRTIDERYTMPYGKARQHHVVARDVPMRAHGGFVMRLERRR